MAYTEDVIRYWLFPLQSDGAVVTDLAELQSYSDVYLTFLHKYTENYIWNQDPLHFKAVDISCAKDVTGPVLPHLYGETCVGDYVEDEWFITFLLKELTLNFPQLVVRVCDSDGEYLLVEAADHLPSWADPDTAEQRVFLRQGLIHLLPPDTVVASPASAVLPMMEGVTAVSSRPSDTLASPHIQQAIALRIQEYPGRVSREQHVAHAYVPVGVAALLREFPTLVAPAVTAFCARDAMDNKALRVMRHFPPEQRVVTAVRFSKALYAKLQFMPYSPDLRTGWQLPPPQHQDYAKHALGVKLACGFELLVCNAGGVTPTTSPNSDGTGAAATDSVTANPRWGRYRQTLTDRGYFRGELSGSKLYKELEGNALRYFSQHMLKADPGKDSNMDTLSAGSMVVKLLPTVNADLDFFKERENRLVPADSDSWLTVSPEMLDEIMKKQCGQSSAAEASNEQLQSGLETFLSNPSDLDGVEVPDDLQEKLRKLSTMSLPRRKHSAAPSRKTSTAARKASQSLAVHPQARKISSMSVASNSSEMSNFSSKMDFNADSIVDALKNMLELGVPEDDYWQGSDDESSGLSSYGDEDSNEGDCGQRKISSGSQDSGSSGQGSTGAPGAADGDLRSAMRAMEDELRNSTVGENMRARDTNAATSSDTDDDHDGEFDDVEDFAPVKVDAETVQQLVKAYAGEKGQPGPASTLLASMSMKPK